MKKRACIQMDAIDFFLLSVAGGGQRADSVDQSTTVYDNENVVESDIAENSRFAALKQPESRHQSWLNLPAYRRRKVRPARTSSVP